MKRDSCCFFVWFVLVLVTDTGLILCFVVIVCFTDHS